MTEDRRYKKWVYQTILESNAEMVDYAKRFSQGVRLDADPEALWDKGVKILRKENIRISETVLNSERIFLDYFEEKFCHLDRFTLKAAEARVPAAKLKRISEEITGLCREETNERGFFWIRRGA